MIESVGASRLSVSELAEIERLFTSFPIEVAECCASEKQLRFQEAFFSRRNPFTGLPADVFVAMGGNRSGKSIVCGAMCFAKFVRDEARDGDVFWCIGQTLDRSIGGQQKELWNALPRWMFGDQHWDEKGGFASGEHAKVTIPTIDGGKCLIEFRSCDQKAHTFEQAKLRGIWVDERMPEKIYDRLIARLVDQNSWILYSDIPEQFWHITRLKEAMPAARVLYQHFEMMDNAHNLPADAITAATARMTREEQQLRIEGLFVNMVGLVFAKEYRDALKPNGHLVKRFTIPPDWPRWRLIDYGGSAPTACSWWAIAPNEHAYCYREHYEEGLSVQRNAQMIIDKSAGEKYVATLIDPHAIDKPPAYYGSSPTVAEQYATAGIATIGWPYINVVGEHAAVQCYKFRLENNTIHWFEDLINYRREMRSWKYKTDADGKPLASDAFENENNHLIDGGKGWLCTHPCFTQLKIRVTGGSV